jgi:hypothetical protein
VKLKPWPRALDGQTFLSQHASHPMAPDSPLYETVAGLMAARFDKLGDLFRKFPNEEDETGKQ